MAYLPRTNGTSCIAQFVFHAWAVNSRLNSMPCSGAPFPVPRTTMNRICAPSPLTTMSGAKMMDLVGRSALATISAAATVSTVQWSQPNAASTKISAGEDASDSCHPYTESVDSLTVVSDSSTFLPKLVPLSLPSIAATTWSTTPHAAMSPASSAISSETSQGQLNSCTSACHRSAPVPNENRLFSPTSAAMDPVM